MDRADACDAYRRACLDANILPCYETLASLERGETALSAKGDGLATALLSFLSKTGAPGVTSVNFGGAALSPGTIAAICTFVRDQNVSVRTLHLRKTKLRDKGASMLLSALLAAGAETPLRELDIRSNKLSFATAKSLGAALLDRHNGGIGKLTAIDVSNNHMGHKGVAALNSAIASRGKGGPEVSLRAAGNMVVVETLNGITHGLGVLFTIIFGTLLVATSYPLVPFSQTLSLTLFCASLCTMFLSSTLYHSFHRIPPAHRFFHTADHCSIFVLIAGSYTPFIVCYAMDPPTVLGAISLCVIWICAIVGVLISFKIIPANPKVRSFFALGMGWSGVLVGPTILSRMPTAVMVYVVAGGLSYTGGTVFYLMGRSRPVLHVIWHLAVMLGGGLHIYAHFVRARLLGGAGVI